MLCKFQRNEKALSLPCKVRLVMAATAFIGTTSIFGGGILAAAPDQRVLVIGIDGLRADALEAANAPNIKSLYENGAGMYARGLVEDLTFSGPGWSAIINGGHHDVTGVASNNYNGHNFSAYPNLLARLKSFNPNLVTGRYTTWDQINNNFANPNNVNFNSYHDLYNDADKQPAEPDHIGDFHVVNDLVNQLANGDMHAAFVYNGHVDDVGHGSGFSPTSSNYLNEIHEMDQRMGQVLNAIRNRPGVISGDENWLVILTSDHGGLPNGGHGGNALEQRETPFIVSSLNGQGVHADTPFVRPRNVDVTKTALQWMGVPQSQWGNADGHVVGLAPSNAPAAEFHRNLIFNGDGEYDRGFTDHGIDQAVSGWNDQDQTNGANGYHSMTLLQYGTPGGYPDANTPGPNERENNFFSGGSQGAESVMTQELDLAALEQMIDNDDIEFVLSGYLGGFSSQNDRMQLTAFFRDENGQVIGQALLNAVTNGDRNNNTSLVYREATGLMPIGARSVLFELKALQDSGMNDGYADNLSFELLIPEPTSAMMIISAGGLLGLQRRR